MMHCMHTMCDAQYFYTRKYVRGAWVGACGEAAKGGTEEIINIMRLPFLPQDMRWRTHSVHVRIRMIIIVEHLHKLDMVTLLDSLYVATTVNT